MPSPPLAPAVDETLSTPFSLARSAFDAMGSPANGCTQSSGNAIASSSIRSMPSPTATPRRPVASSPVDLSIGDDESKVAGPSGSQGKIKPADAIFTKSKAKPSTQPPATGQTKLSSFFAQPTPENKWKTPPASSQKPAKRRSTSAASPDLTTSQAPPL